MAQLDFTEKVEDFYIENSYQPSVSQTIERTDVMTGGKNKKRFLFYQLKTSIAFATKIDIIVAFLMESGVRMILEDLKEALERGVSIRILTGNYLGITQPSALYLIKNELGNKVQLRFFDEKKRSFHPKAYIFHREDMGEIYIGSSNISKSALTSGIEWNYRFTSQSDNKNFQLFYDTFEDLFYNHSIEIDDEELRRYSKSWHRPAVSKDLSRYDCYDEEINYGEQIMFQPRGAQIEALYALKKSRLEGAKKGLVHAATGIGKTYLAAFDSASYKRVLFVAHREEILKQAAVSFKNVRQNNDYGFFCGKQKDTDKSVIFASAATLGKKEYLTEKYFARDYFDYIVIDEFHHAVNEQYYNIIRYFSSEFMLGLTATPERMDGKNIYEICDYNVPYEISLKEAINRGLLVPFHYYGIYDETDYSHINRIRGYYDEKELTHTYENNKKRCDLIYKYYRKYGSKQALGFCCSRKHAEQMAKEFCMRGVPSVAVYSSALGEFAEDREIAIKKLEQQEIKVIFSVDMFNEGVDIPSVDMVMFLRPTESPIVFLQQLGRGLRIHKGKEYLTVLDFIGNYEKAGNSASLLCGGSFFSEEQYTAGIGDYGELEYPDDCIVDFDMRLIDLFQEMAKKSLSLKEQISREYFRVKELLAGKVPSRIEFFTYMRGEVYEYCMRHAKENPFRRYMEFLHNLHELSEEEEWFYSGIGREFISVLETTDMQKVYKMPVLYSFYNHGDIRMAVTETELLESWKEFFDSGTNWKDFQKGISYEDYKKMTDKQHLNKAKTMPVKFLKASGKGFFTEKEGYVIALADKLQGCVKSNILKYHMKDILEYRTMEYYRRRYIKKYGD